MAKTDYKIYYFTAIAIGVAVWIKTEDKFLGILVMIAGALFVGGLRQKSRQKQKNKSLNN
jgi:hypothetical protein